MLMSYIYATLDSVITAIKYDVFNINCITNFVNFVITLYSDKKEFFSKHLIKDIVLFKKYNFIINHIYFPQNNFIDKYKIQENLNKNQDKDNDKDNEKENIQIVNYNNNNSLDNFILEKVIEKYDINKYLIKTKEDFSLNTEELKNNIFHAGINPYIKDDPEMQIFMENYTGEKNNYMKDKDLMISNFIEI
jgi:hypothetical protein